MGDGRKVSWSQREDKESASNADGVSGWNSEKIREKDGGNGGRTVRRRSMPVDCVVKVGKDDTFYKGAHILLSNLLIKIHF